MWHKKIKKNLGANYAKIQTQLKNKWEIDAFYTRTVTTFIAAKYIGFKKTVIPIQKRAMDISVATLLLVIGVYVFFPTTANADIEQGGIHLDEQTVAIIIDSMQNKTRPFGSLPISEESEPRRTYSIPMTAYTSEAGQTDDTPCITASGLDVCERGIENVVAANFLPLGTRVRIPELYGDRVFYVEDRMNRRYDKKMDIWMKHKSDAINFGLKYTTIEVF